MYTPNTGFVGVDSFSYTISDGKGGSDTATVTITVGMNPIDVSISTVCTPHLLMPSELVTCELRYSNNSDSALTGITVSTMIPSALQQILGTT